jgi:hypothetical protein
MPNRSGAKVATDDFDDMLAEFAASDLKNAAITNIADTTSATITTASTYFTAPNPTEEDIVEACAAGNLSLLRRWGRRGIRVVSPGPLLEVVLRNDLDMMRCLVMELGADVNQMRDDGARQTTVAAELGSIEVMRCLVKELGANVNLAGHDGWTPLLRATLS